MWPSFYKSGLKIEFNNLKSNRIRNKSLAPSLSIWQVEFSQKKELIRRLQEWDNVWKSRGGIIVNGVPTEFPRAKPEEPQVPRVLAAGLPEGLHSP